MIEVILSGMATVAVLSGRQRRALILTGWALLALSYDSWFGHSHFRLLLASMLAAPAAALGLTRWHMAQALPVALLLLGIMAEGGPVHLCRDAVKGFHAGYEEALSAHQSPR